MLSINLSENYRSHSRIMMRRMIGGTPATKGEVPFIMAIFRRGYFKGSFSLITTKTAVGAAHVIHQMPNVFTTLCHGVPRNSKMAQTSHILANQHRASHWACELAILTTIKEHELQNNFIGRTYIQERNLPYTKCLAGRKESTGNGRKEGGSEDSRQVHWSQTFTEQLEPIVSTPTLYPVAVADRNQTYISGHATLAGWGRIGENLACDDLQTAVVTLTDPSPWLKRFQFPLKGTDIISRDSGIIAMEGDSGSPLTRKDQFGRQILIGVVSARDQSTRVIVYMSTSFYCDFIKDNSEGEVTFL
ncbi:uncharacterized protein LOC111624596 [Centruroides sculpturatus]|uniref:uncharacterized protein LOC111624596 n=1 Tax=Centruroides sculpturatus TaxID=218467 RepID=UPI000C6DD505|nr:uncharacterized protein LOC111624596 [Centruroides sculpturatus]